MMVCQYHRHHNNDIMATDIFSSLFEGRIVQIIFVFSWDHWILSGESILVNLNSNTAKVGDRDVCSL